jgi:serine/threonine protein kinase
MGLEGQDEEQGRHDDIIGRDASTELPYRQERQDEGMSGSESDDPLIGRRIGPAELQRKLGEGGMGAVYLGRHPGLNRPVAVKILSAALAQNAEFIQRFQREARLAARLEHPNVVQVHDVGEQDGLHYIVMQYVEGKSLDQILKERRKLSLNEALSITKRVAVALAAAARLGIVHRDIKPHNILISKDGMVKVADFGLAKDNDANRTISETGQIVGTPYFMSPEQAEGKAVDPRGDLYSLGATLYPMLTGKRLFEGSSPLAIVMKQIREQPVPVRELDPSIPPAVEALLDRLLRKDPGERFASAEALVKAIDALKGPAEKTRAPVRRRAILSVAGILAAGILLGLLLGKPPAAAPAPVPPPVAAPQPLPPAPSPPKKPDPKEGVLSRFRDAAERRWGEEIYARTEEFLKAAQKKDFKTLKGMLDTLTFGSPDEQVFTEILSKVFNEKVTLEGWEIEDIDVRVRTPGRPQPHAVASVAYHLKTPNSELKLQHQAVFWVRRIDGQWYLTRNPRK